MTKAEEIQTVVRIRYRNRIRNTVVYLSGGHIHYGDGDNQQLVGQTIRICPWVGVFNAFTSLDEIEAGLARVMGYRRAA